HQAGRSAAVKRNDDRARTGSHLGTTFRRSTACRRAAEGAHGVEPAGIRSRRTHRMCASFVRGLSGRRRSAHRPCRRGVRAGVAPVLLQMKILLSWSSGKDSAWALHVLNRQHPGAVAGLLTTVNEAMDRVAMHGVRRSVLEAQARAAGLPLHVVHIPHPCPNDIYEAQMRTAVAEARAQGFT